MSETETFVPAGQANGVTSKNKMQQTFRPNVNAAEHIVRAESDTALPRRRFLIGAAALGAAAFIPGTDTPAEAAMSKLIDTHHHFYPPAYQKAWAA